MTKKIKKKKLAPPWNFADVKPPENVPLVFLDNLNLYVGIWTTRVGKANDPGGFATVTRKARRNSSIDTSITLVENVRSWMLLPDQKQES